MEQVACMDSTAGKLAWLCHDTRAAGYWLCLPHSLTYLTQMLLTHNLAVQHRFQVGTWCM